MTELAVALIAQGAILALVLCVMESRFPAANRFLAALLVAISLRLLAQLLVNHFSAGRQLLNALHNTAFLIGPLLYFYTRALIERPLRLRPRQLWHLLPAALATLWSLSPFAGYERAPTDSAVVRISSAHGLLATLSIALYCGVVLRGLAAYRLGLLERYSAIERISLNWLRTLVLIVLFGGGATAVVNVLRLAGGWPLDPTWMVVPLSVALFYAVAIFGFRQSTVLLIGVEVARAEPLVAPDVPREPAAEQPAAAEKYRRSGLDEERALQIWGRLRALMEQEPLFLDPDLQLAVLAQRLDVSPQILSEVLGKMAGARFYDYINRLRVARAQQLLADTRRDALPVLDIAFAAGFKTKSSFNKYFKQAVGMTPSEYRRSLPGTG